MELTWTPTVAEACRHTFTLSDGRKINRDIAVILKSVNPKVIARVWLNFFSRQIVFFYVYRELILEELKLIKNRQLFRWCEGSRPPKD